MTIRNPLSVMHVWLRFALLRGAWMGLVSVSFGCADVALVHSFNDLPVARATVYDPVTKAMLDVAADGGLGPVTFPYNGSPVRIVLDALGSHDNDGHITAYRWLSGTRTPDAGVPARLVPAGQQQNWPADEAMPAVDLGPGLWTFTLWVRDDHNAWSVPDTIRVVIGSVASPRPAAVGTPALVLTGLDAGTHLPSVAWEEEEGP